MTIRRMGLIWVVPLVASLAAWPVAGQKNDQAEVRLKAAVHRELVDGDLKGAIAQYQQIIKSYSGNRTVTARALVQMGQCYEKLGAAEARTAYERVVREFADQSEPVRLARQRLAVLQQPVAPAKPPEISVRRVWAGGIGASTRDGRYVTFMDPSQNLGLYDTVTGQRRLLTKKEPLEFALPSMPSRDGKQVAYGWYNNDSFSDLRVVGLDGSNPRVVYAGARLSEIYPTDWSPDGKSILAFFLKRTQPAQLVMVSVADGAVRVLKTLDWTFPLWARFSPDGRYVACNVPQQERPDAHDVCLLDVERGREIPLVQHPADDRIFDWSPDGRGILFGSDRSGAMDAWWIRVADGKGIGTPSLVRADLGRDITPMGFTSNGSFYYGVTTPMSDVYIAELDLERGRILSEPILATQRFAGSNSYPQWSDDGKELYFLSSREPGVWGAKAFCVRNTETGAVREVASKLNRMGWVQWSTDGRYMLGPASIDNTFIPCLIDTQTGEFERFSAPRGPGLHPAWSRDSKAVFYYQWADKTTHIVLHELATGREQVLHSIAPATVVYASPVLSRDGQHLAFVVNELGESGARVLKAMPASGGEARELMREEPPLMRRPIVWLPDSENLLFMRWSGTDASKTGFWRISIRGGEPRKLDLPESFLSAVVAGQMRDLCLHPDGRHIAYTAGRDRSEVWVMENFLPPGK